MPFSIEVKTPEVRTSQGAVRTLDDFVKLAKEDFREAYQLFVEPSFTGFWPDGRIFFHVTGPWSGPLRPIRIWKSF